MSATLIKNLNLMPGTTMNIQYNPKRHLLKTGTLLGILINTDLYPDKQDPAAGLMTRFFEECSIAGKSRGIVVTVFKPSDLSLGKQLIHGMIFKDQQWTYTKTPLPDIIYNRITSRKIENQASIQEALQQLRNKHNVSIFNEKFLNKKQVYDFLKNIPEIRTYLPETYVYQTPLLLPLLNKYHTVFLKPSNGSHGSGVMKVSCPKEVYTIEYTTADGNAITLTFDNHDDILYSLKRKTRRNPYLIQQGLNLVRIQKRSLDFRILVQKNRQGEWAVTSAVGRIANDQHVVSNLARGGTVLKASDALEEINVPTKPTVKELCAHAKSIAQSFDQVCPGHFAELGIDLALDNRGKSWLLEINSKPSKTDDTVTEERSIPRPSARRLMDYCYYLSKQSLLIPNPTKSQQKKSWRLSI
ncbi:YheC/YheD family protein [Mechercharimyces sp. CAU 1602]|nr:YheC/YheD family protein [Mechercharimyces sp. CAU 1602]